MKKTEEDDDDDISDNEDAIMLSREAKDWKVCISVDGCLVELDINSKIEPRPLCRPGSEQVPLACYPRADQACSPQEGAASPP